jgi:hypothetical protein
MANPTINYLTNVITIPQSFLNLISGVSYTLDSNALRNALKALEASEGITFPPTHTHNTEVLLGGIVYARVIEILSPYTITFQEMGTPYSVSIVGSNNNILDRTNLGTVQIRSSNSAGLVNQKALEQATESMKYQIEGLRDSHPGIGGIYFVSPTGDDNASGLLPTSPKRTINGALASCISGQGDVINILAPGVGQAVYVENVVIDKEDVHLRGPGRGVLIQPTSGNVVTINADNCSMESLFIKTAAGSSGDDGIVVNGKFALLQDLYLVGPDTGGVTPVGTGNGIHFRGGDYHKVRGNVIEKFGGAGVMFDDAGLTSGSPREVVFDGNQIYFNRQHGVHLTGTSSNSTRLNIFMHNKVTHNSEYGVYIGNNTQRTMINATNYIKDNGTYPSGAGGTEIYYLPDLTTDAMIDNMPDIMPAAVAAAVSSTGLSTEQNNMLLEMYRLLGLDPTKPLIVSKTNRTAGIIGQSISEAADGTVTVTRI